MLYELTVVSLEGVSRGSKRSALSGKDSRDSKGEHSHQAILGPRSQLQSQDDRDRQDHEQDIGNNVHRGVKEEVARDINTLSVKFQAVVPGAPYRLTGEKVSQFQHKEGGGDVADRGVTDFAESGLRAEAEVEEQHGDFGNGIGDGPEDGFGVAVLSVC